MYPLQQLNFKIKRLRGKEMNNYNIRCESNGIIFLAKRDAEKEQRGRRREQSEVRVQSIFLTLINYFGREFLWSYGVVGYHSRLWYNKWRHLATWVRIPLRPFYYSIFNKLEYFYSNLYYKLQAIFLEFLIIILHE